MRIYKAGDHKGFELTEAVTENNETKINLQAFEEMKAICNAIEYFKAYTDRCEQIGMREDMRIKYTDYKVALKVLELVRGGVLVKPLDNSQPLTLKQLKERVGKPIYWKGAGGAGWWRIVIRITDQFMFFHDGETRAINLGVIANAYDHEPSQQKPKPVIFRDSECPECGSMIHSHGTGLRRCSMCGWYEKLMHHPV